MYQKYKDEEQDASRTILHRLGEGRQAETHRQSDADTAREILTAGPEDVVSDIKLRSVEDLSGPRVGQTVVGRQVDRERAAMPWREVMQTANLKSGRYGNYQRTLDSSERPTEIDRIECDALVTVRDEFDLTCGSGVDIRPNGMGRRAS